jgi:hypothetical protein
MMTGIGTGNFEIEADGQLTTWQLFNTLRDGQVLLHVLIPYRPPQGRQPLPRSFKDFTPASTLTHGPDRRNPLIRRSGPPRRN